MKHKFKTSSTQQPERPENPARREFGLTILRLTALASLKLAGCSSGPNVCEEPDFSERCGDVVEIKKDKSELVVGVRCVVSIGESFEFDLYNFRLEEISGNRVKIFVYDISDTQQAVDNGTDCPAPLRELDINTGDTKRADLFAAYDIKVHEIIGQQADIEVTFVE